MTLMRSPRRSFTTHPVRPQWTPTVGQYSGVCKSDAVIRHQMGSWVHIGGGLDLLEGEIRITGNDERFTVRQFYHT